MSGEIHEECGVFGVYSRNAADVAGMVYLGLYALQHRGQESCGIVVSDNGSFKSHKDLGLISDVFSPGRLDALGSGNIAVGHVRYGTTGASSRANCQPVEVYHMKESLALAHNGNLTNSEALREKLELDGAIFHSTSDTETIAYVITRERLKHRSVPEAINSAMDIIKGAYSLAVMTKDELIAVRDPNGFRPLCYGITKDGCYCVASESCALQAVGATFIRDICPGEIVAFSKKGVTSITDHCGACKKTMCVFEYIYFARPDSVIDGVSVHNARISSGMALAKEHPVEADVVIGVPDSGIDAALGYSMQSKIPYGIGFVKNKYIGRTFILPGQPDRESKVRIKLNPIESTVKGKRVVMVDDSIVRGTTSAIIVRLLREAGAVEVHMRVSAPPFTHPCYYGTDIDSCENLIACHRSVDEIAKIIGVDSLGYLSLNDVDFSGKGDGFCTACFGGGYPTDVPDNQSKFCFENQASGAND